MTSIIKVINTDYLHTATDVKTTPALNMIVFWNNASVAWPVRMVFSGV
jgi:hypothetical protein